MMPLQVPVDHENDRHHEGTIGGIPGRGIVGVAAVLLLVGGLVLLIYRNDASQESVQSSGQDVSIDDPASGAIPIVDGVLVDGTLAEVPETVVIPANDAKLWSVSAAVRPNGELCVVLDRVGPTSSSMCGAASKLSAASVTGSTPSDGGDAIVYGVVQDRFFGVEVEIGDQNLPSPTFSHPSFPGVRFFAVEGKPTGDLEALLLLDEAGEYLGQKDPERLPLPLGRPPE